MTFATLKTIHEVLTDHVDYLDELLQDAGRMLDETCARHEADAEQGDKEARKAIDEAEARRAAIRAEWNKARDALAEFEAQDWR